MAKKQKFFRVDTHKHSKLGVRRKKKQKYRRPTGPDNKIRLNEKGRLRKVKIGFKRENISRGLIKGMIPIMVFNINDLKKVKSGMIGIIGNIGLKRKKEIAEYVLKNKINLLNFNAEKILDYVKNKINKSKEEKIKRYEEKKFREEKAKEKESEIKKSEEEKDKKTEEKLEEMIDKKIEEKNQEVKNESK